MKKLLIIAIFMCSIMELSAQTRQISLSNSGFFVGQSIRVLSEPMIEFRKGRKGWKFGPTIVLLGESTASDKKYPKLSGFSTSYLFYPVNTTKKFDFYLFTTARFQLISNKWKSQIWDIDTGSYQSHSYKSDELLITQHVGYGLILNLHERFSLRQGVGIGPYYSATDNNEQSAGAPEIDDMNLSGYNKFGFSWLLNLEINYSF